MSIFIKLKESIAGNIIISVGIKIDILYYIEHSNSLIEQSHYFTLSIMARYRNKKKNNGTLFGEILKRIIGKF